MQEIGAHGIECRYPFRDRALVQNREYKGCILHYLQRGGYPVDVGRKNGFAV